MSITGISNYGLQNVTNENIGADQYTDLTSRVEQCETDITALEGQVDAHETDITALQTQTATNTTNITAVQAVNTTQDTSIASILQRITDITYFSATDQTTIANRLQISNVIDSATSTTPQLTLRNTSIQAPNQILLELLCGVESGSWSSLVQEGDNLFLSRRHTTAGVDTYQAGMVFTNHSSPGTTGFRFSFNPAVASVFRSNINMENKTLTTTGNITTGTLTLSGVNLQTAFTTGTVNTGVLNLSGVNVQTTLTGLQTQIDAIDHHTLTQDLECASFDINACGTLTAVEVIAGGYNVKNRIVTLQNEVQALEDVNHNLAPADLDMNGFKLLDARELQLVTGSKVATLSIEDVDDMKAHPPLNGNFVVSTSASGVGAKSFTITHDVVDFNGRMITNASFYPLNERAQQEIDVPEDWVIHPFTIGANSTVQGRDIRWRLTGSSSGVVVSNETATSLTEHTAQHPGVAHFRLEYNATIGYVAHGTLTWDSEQCIHSSAMTTSRTIFKVGSRGSGIYTDFRIRVGLALDTTFASAIYWECSANGAWRLIESGTTMYTSTDFLNFNAGSWLCAYFIRITGGMRCVLELSDHSVVDTYDFIGSRPGRVKPIVQLTGLNVFVSGTPDRDLYLDYMDLQYSATRV